MNRENVKIDTIVVGGGPSGIASAITIARGGKNVVVLERSSQAGKKNMFGGAFYTQSILEIFPDFFEKINDIPIQRFNNQHKYILLTKDQSVSIDYKKNINNDFYNNKKDLPSSFTVFRSEFDNWLLEQAKKEGVYFSPDTVVRSLIYKNGKVIGVKTDIEEIYAPIVILADGVNSLLAKEAGLRDTIQPKDVALGVKEVIKLPCEVINERFNLKDNQGCIFEFLGYPLDKTFGLGFMYINKESISIGLGIALDDLSRAKKKPYEYLEELKKHPSISPYIENGELIEYNAHLIPEGGYNKIPKLYSDGVMIVGDAAMLVNNLHFEGTNLALISGKFAGETALQALEFQDYSSNMLKLYQKKIENSFIFKDLKSYRNLVATLHSRKNSFLNYYPEKLCKFFNIFTSANGKPKKNLFKSFIMDFFKDRSIIELLKDSLAVLKLLFEVFK